MSPVAHWAVTGYRFALQTNLDPEAGRSGLTGMIRLLGRDGPIGCIDFVHDGEPLPGARREADGSVRMALPHSQYPVVIDLLRNETDVSLHWSETERRAWLGTAHADAFPMT